MRLLVGSESLGFKSIAAYLNDRQIRTRDGGKFGLDAIHQILHRPSYMGEHHFNRTSAKLKRRKPDEEHVICKVPAIVTPEEFQAVQDSLHLRSWKQTRPNHVTSRVLLGGIAFCGKCGGAMTLRTGCSSTGLQYRYYTCSTKARQGPTGCEDITVREEKLDNAVVEHLERRLLHPERLEVLLGNVIDKRGEWIERRLTHVVELRQRATQAAAKLTSYGRFQ